MRPARPQFVPFVPFVPITPPSSLAGTPVLDDNENFQYGNFQSLDSTLNLDAIGTHIESKGAHTRAGSRYPKWIPQIDKEVTLLCLLWYGFSIVSANSTKAILLQFLYPVTLTQLQFVINSALCVSLFCVLSAFPAAALSFLPGQIPNLESLNFSVQNFIKPSAFIISTTLPMGLFQFAGHITSHKATCMIPVSLVHTVKALSPLATVLIYRILFRTNFRKITYVTLIPLMVGIMLTCYRPLKSTKSDGYVSGLVYASISMLIFVLQNIFAKKCLTLKDESDLRPKSELPMHSAESSKKLDKLTILLFCSVTGFVFTMPVYVLSEFQNKVFSLAEISPYLMFLVLLNGVLHFLQSLLAFLLLGLISPVNYSIVNIMKRIAVIGFAFVWESSFSFSGTQSYGIVLTAIGLYCYDRWGAWRS
ncbi:TPT-domain-containing protein [Metschnikowia bicuspidata]|uniref:TPT-domain-containing protein n=1 Tax=Metschnikowia bicuspidata TaxID=27322 RepID=A0A4P9ZEZ4_9ASCO|nr:TPT-domain-containing protein [Metschnikowia bicuspidata]